MDSFTLPPILTTPPVWLLTELRQVLEDTGFGFCEAGINRRGLINATSSLVS